MFQAGNLHLIPYICCLKKENNDHFQLQLDHGRLSRT